MGFAGYVAICVQLYCRCFTVLHLVVTVYTTCFGLHGHLQVCRGIFSFTFLKESALLVLLARGYTLRVSFVFFCSVFLVIFLFLACVFVCLFFLVNKKRQAEENRTEKQMKRAKCNHVQAKPAKQIPSRI
jgi:predicted membrane protein